MGRDAFCRICNARQHVTRCWLQVDPVNPCTGCGTAFPDPAALYKKFQPACPRCGEFLEQPGFEYGLCDGCGSKYELVPGTKPGLLPNRTQRAAMAKYGHAWRRE
jgi:hypothetical protein